MDRAIRPEAATYRLTCLLGEGLSSRVFAAIREDSRGFSRQEVVLKILKTETEVSWLKREFAVLTRFRSPHCVSVFGWENLPDGPALVLERIHGLTLDELYRKHAEYPLGSAEIEEIVRQIQDGLAALHQQGLYHGDLSPRNVMVDRSGTVRLIDFALHTANEPGVINGTPPYICKERWEGQPGGVASDLFSLGLMRLDLHCGLDTAPLDARSCRDRIEAVASLGCPLLEADPGKRRMRLIMESENARRQLGSMVRAILDAADAEQRTTTAILQVKSASGPRSASRAKGVFFSFFSIWVLVLQLVLIPQKFGPDRFSSAINKDTLAANSVATVRIRSLKWLRVDFDGKEHGYAPLSISVTRPGRHRIRWETAQASGESVIVVKPGERHILTEDILRRQNVENARSVR